MNYLLAPHSDDEALFAAYICARHHPKIIVCLKSARQASISYPGGPILAETREAETNRSAFTLGCAWEQWPIPDDKPDWEAMRSLIQELDWQDEYVDTVYAPAVEEGGNEQHNLIGEIALEIFGARVTPYLTYTNGRDHSRWGLEVIPTAEEVSAKLRALACYTSQIACPATGHHFINNDLREFIVA